MPKTKRGTPPHETSCFSVPTESPVPGVKIELANLLVQAIKTRRKFLSKSASSSQAADEDEEKEALRRSLLQNLENSAADKTTAFLNELKRQVEHSASASKSSSRRSSSKSNAPKHCLEFLLEILSNGSNSFHLRRSGLSLAREILERSSDARAYLVSGQCLLDFVSVVEGVEYDQGDNDESSHPETLTNSLSPKSMFQLEAMELIHHLATKFGKFYTQFTVASRLLGDVSVHFSMNNDIQNDPTNREDSRPRSQREKMRILRKERDIALECGVKACLSLGRMIDRADEYFRVLVPRFGGFNSKPSNAPNELDATTNNTSETEIPEINAAGDSKPASKSNDTDNHVQHGFEQDGIHRNDGDINDDDGDDDSIDWEEGDVDFSTEHTETTPCDNKPSDATKNEASSIDHEAAVAHTLEIIGRSGALLDGNLAVQVSGKSMESEPAAMKSTTETPTALAPSTEGTADIIEQARTKLQKLVRKFSTRRLPRLNQWIHALSHADGMEERAVVDPATAGVPGSEGPVSIVLLSEEKRVLRGQLLQRMIKVRGEIELVLQSASKLGISAEEAENKNDDNGDAGGAAETPSNNANLENTVRTKRPWKPDSTLMASKNKKSKISRIKVIYKK